MSEQKIILNTIEGAEEFVNAATRCDFSIDVLSGKSKFDAKSILGILSIDLTSKIRVRCHGQDERFNKVLYKYAVN